jgi:hypothetical protein
MSVQLGESHSLGAILLRLSVLLSLLYISNYSTADDGSLQVQNMAIEAHQNHYFDVCVQARPSDCL